MQEPEINDLVERVCARMRECATEAELAVVRSEEREAIARLRTEHPEHVRFKHFTNAFAHHCRRLGVRS